MMEFPYSRNLNKSGYIPVKHFSLKPVAMKMQSVKFVDVEDFLAYLPEDELNVCLLLRKIIRDCMPDAREKLAYNVPFYRRYSNICFIWPASVTWGKNKTWEGVRLGFSRGNLLADPTGLLRKDSRKQVYWHDFQTIQEIHPEEIRALVYEAILIDEEPALKK
jgi:hypothetical protein